LTHCGRGGSIPCEKNFLPKNCSAVDVGEIDYQTDESEYMTRKLDFRNARKNQMFTAWKFDDDVEPTSLCFYAVAKRGNKKISVLFQPRDLILIDPQDLRDTLPSEFPRTTQVRKLLSLGQYPGGAILALLAADRLSISSSVFIAGGSVLYSPCRTMTPVSSGGEAAFIFNLNPLQ
jgi:hypothetical protein